MGTYCESKLISALHSYWPIVTLHKGFRTIFFMNPFPPGVSVVFLVTVMTGWRKNRKTSLHLSLTMSWLPGYYQVVWLLLLGKLVVLIPRNPQNISVRYMIVSFASYQVAYFQCIRLIGSIYLYISHMFNLYTYLLCIPIILTYF